MVVFNYIYSINNTYGGFMSKKSDNLEALRSIIENTMPHYILLYKNGMNMRNGYMGRVLEYPIGLRETDKVEIITIKRPDIENEDYKWELLIPSFPNYDSVLLYMKVEEIIEAYINYKNGWNKRLSDEIRDQIETFID